MARVQVSFERVSGDDNGCERMRDGASRWVETRRPNRKVVAAASSRTIKPKPKLELKSSLEYQHRQTNKTTHTFDSPL